MYNYCATIFTKTRVTGRYVENITPACVYFEDNLLSIFNVKIYFNEEKLIFK